MKLRVFYEDNHILVAEKPAGMPSQADATGAPDMLCLVKSYVKEKYSKPGEAYIGLVHRLDRPAAGLMVFARTSKAAARLAEQVRTRQMQKKYLAVVAGDGLPDRGDGGLSLKGCREKYFPQGAAPEKGAKRAVLEYRVLEARQGQALVLVHLETGRPHQIRLQFALRGWSLVGDAKYGSGGQDLALYSCFLGFCTRRSEKKWNFAPCPEWERLPGLKKDCERRIFAGRFAIFYKKSEKYSRIFP